MSDNPLATPAVVASAAGARDTNIFTKIVLGASGFHLKPGQVFPRPGPFAATNLLPYPLGFVPPTLYGLEHNYLDLSIRQRQIISMIYLSPHGDDKLLQEEQRREFDKGNRTANAALDLVKFNRSLDYLTPRQIVDLVDRGGIDYLPDHFGRLQLHALQQRFHSLTSEQISAARHSRDLDRVNASFDLLKPPAPPRLTPAERTARDLFAYQVQSGGSRVLLEPEARDVLARAQNAQQPTVTGITRSELLPRVAPSRPSTANPLQNAASAEQVTSGEDVQPANTLLAEIAKHVKAPMKFLVEGRRDP